MSQSDESEEEFVPRTRDTSTPVTLERFFRILGAAGSQVYLHQGDADSNDDLIEQLVSDGAIHDDRIKTAMLACDRRRFVPLQYKDMAYVDQPIHVAEWDSNISAPHIYTTFLNELEIREGMAIVDVGSGSGISTAYCAMMAGKTGYVTGIDINKRCVDWSINVLNELHASSEPFRSTAAPTRIVHKDAFIACYEEEFKGKYDRVFVGASCPRARAHSFFQFLKPEGGKVVIPIAPSELSLIELAPESTPCISEIAKVRFTSLDLPSEIDVMQAVLKSRRKERLRIVQMPSTYDQDLVNIEHATLLAHYDTISSSPEDVIEGFPNQALQVCEMADYYGVPRMVNYCENVLADILKKAETSERHIRECCDVAINLFIMGQALSLGQLTAVSLDFLATHFELMKESESFRSLDAGHIVLIAEEAHNQVLEMKSIMQELRASASYAKQES
ncbi:hypothetical protein M9435_005926 [Picochlorum sp. BPE23]|nr:hypothetical protein M9435_005926 [Picochlorum sp. BPE23]